jgi:hypothetical protein
MLTTQANDKIVSMASSKNKIIVLTASGNVYTKGKTQAEVPQVVPVAKELMVSASVDNFKGVVDCFQHNDICVICGIGGCYTVTWNTGATAPAILQRLYFTKKFTYKNKVDYVMDVKTLYKSNYFLALESVVGGNSGGIIRYDVTATSANCWINYSPRYPGTDGTAYMSPWLTSPKVVLSHPPLKKFLFVDTTTMTRIFEHTLTDATKEVFGNVATFTHTAIENRFVSCVPSGTLTCTSYQFQYSATDGYAVAVKQHFKIGTAAAQTQSPVPTYTPIFVFEPTKTFAVLYGKNVLIYDTDGAGTGPIAETHYATATEHLYGGYDTIASPSALFYGLYKVFSTKYTLATAVCSPACDATGKCGTSCFRSQDCTTKSAVKAPYINSAAFELVTFSEAIVTTPAEVKKVIPKYASDPATRTYSVDGHVCTNTTLLAAPAGATTINPNTIIYTNATAINSTNKSSGMSGTTIFLIVAGIILGLALIGGIIAAAVGGGSKSKNYQMGGMGAQNMNGFGHQGMEMGGMGMGGMGSPMGPDMMMSPMDGMNNSMVMAGTMSPMNQSFVGNPMAMDNGMGGMGMPSQFDDGMGMGMGMNQSMDMNNGGVPFGGF